jgi:hypothetical protein
VDTNTIIKHEFSIQYKPTIEAKGLNNRGKVPSKAKGLSQRQKPSKIQNIKYSIVILTRQGPQNKKLSAFLSG